MAVSMLHPACVAQVQMLAALVGARIEYSTDSTTWMMQGQTRYAMLANVEPTAENIARYGVPVALHAERLILPKLRSDFAYAVALHELGHAFTGEDELVAWAWAYENALYWSPMMWRVAYRSIASYAKGQPQRYPLEHCAEVLAALRPFRQA